VKLFEQGHCAMTIASGDFTLIQDCWLQVEQQYLITSMDSQHSVLLAVIREHMREDRDFKVCPPRLKSLHVLSLALAFTSTRSES
jgi:hypothetical protein